MNRPFTEACPSDCRRKAVACSAVILLVLATVGAREQDEAPPEFTAGALLTPAVAQGPHYRVADSVPTEGYFHRFSLTSDFGSFEAIGRTELAVRIQEIAALAALQDVSKTEVFLTAAGQSVVKVGQSAAAAVTDPGGTVKGLGAGIKRFGVNLGRRTERAAASATDAGAEAGDETTSGQSAGATAANSVLGVNAAMRRWAQKVGADPYTTNVVLKKALEDIAKVDAAGSIATKVVVPIPGVVGMTSTVGGLVWGKDPEALRKSNEEGLRVLKVPDAVAKKLFGNRWLTLTSQTRIVVALRSVNVSGVADYVRTAAEARSQREALFFVESAEMLQRAHARTPVLRILTDSRAMVAVGAGGTARALLPLDWISWTASTATALREISRRGSAELGATRFELGLTGRASDRAMGEFKKLGWTVVQEATGD
jgi:hypothetical protein